MNCKQIRKWIPLVAGGDGDPEADEAVRAHAALCPECARELERYSRQISLLGSVREAPVPPGLFQDLAGLALARGREPLPAAPARPLHRRLEFVLPLGAAAAMLLLAAVYAASFFLAPQPAAGPHRGPEPPDKETATIIMPATDPVVVDMDVSEESTFPITSLSQPAEGINLIDELEPATGREEPRKGESRFVLDEIQSPEDAQVSLDF